MSRQSFLLVVSVCLCLFLFASHVPAADRSASDEVKEIVQEFRDKYEIPGVSVSMSRRGKILLADGFGWADQENQIPVNAEHQFRVASISKPVTSVMIFRLIEQEKLNLSDEPFKQPHLLKSYLEDLELPIETRVSLETITIQHLLEHTSGGWPNKYGDPVFRTKTIEADACELIRETFKSSPPIEPPGITYRYSNYGFFILGRVIEAVTGTSYEQAVRDNILKPSGAVKMQVGKREQAPLEVKYYGQGGENPYHRIMNLPRMDSFGGWIATPTELIRFVHHADGFPTVKDVLRSKTFTLMTTPSASNENYACGWCVNKSNNWWHVGSVPGGSGIMVRTHDQFCWAILCNSRSKESDYISALDKLGWKIRSAIMKQ